ncbi:MAG: hypothetical protein RQ754_10155 [Desulfuromonadales bacterium]|nr:hypothetical protein [Desulfuromonadales bacterium]
MMWKLALTVCFALLPCLAMSAQVGQNDGAATGFSVKELSGMSIVGNDEAPKSLYIVPWKSSEIGVENSLNIVVNGDDVPVDRDVFKRQLDFYEVSITNKSGRIN